MKIILTTTIVAILAIGLFGINNSGSNNIGTVYAQMNSDTGMMGNDTGMMNATLAFAQDMGDGGMMGNDTGMMNATLAFAQDMGDGGMMGNDTMSMDNDTGMMMGMEDKGMEMMKLNGTIEVESTIAEAFKSKVTTDIIGAIQAAQASVGANSVVKEAEMTHAHGYLIYKIMVVDENMKKHKVIVDPGNGQVLMKKEVTWYDEYKDKKMKYGHEEERYDKYGSDGHDYKDDKYGGHDDDDYDKKKMMMMKDKKY
jgi:uncharacterized membrane protein YkoI